MATLKAPKTLSKRQELRKDAATTVFVKAQEFFYDNRTLIYGIAAGIVVAILAIVGYVFLQSQRGVQAEEELGGILLVYEKGDYRTALDGTEAAMGLLTIIDDYGSTEAGNLARFYAADALFRLGEYDQALEFFQAFDSGDNVVGASALAGEAAIHELKGNPERAGDLYRRAALIVESDLKSPDYLMKAGRAYEKAGAYDEAREAYLLIQERYPDSAEAQGLEFYLARVRVKLQ